MIVIHLVSERQRSGHPRYAGDLSHRLRTDGINVIAVTRGVREVDGLLSDAGAEIRHLPFGGGWDIITPLGLSRILRHLPDREVIVHTYSLADARTAARARRLAGSADDKNIRIVCDFSGVPEKKRPPVLATDDIPDLFICHGNISQASIKNLIGKNCPPVRMIPVASAPHHTADTGAQEANVSEKILRLLFIGYISPKKGIDTLLEALGKLKNGKWHLTVCGVGNAGNVAPLLKTAKRLGIADSITWTGEIDNPEEYLLKSDVAIFPYSGPDAFAHSIAMAADCAIPVITTSGGDRGGRIISGVNGIIVPPGDAAQLAAEIDRLISDSGLLATLRKGAAESAGAFNSAYSDLIGAYRSIL